MHTALRRLLPLLAFTPALTFAHPSADHVLSFASGLVHPFSGMDHLLAMIAVGMLGARLRHRAIWILPLTFIAMLITGAIVGVVGPPLPLIEPTIAVSIAAFGLLLALKRRVKLATAATVVGIFALAHGYVHGTETMGVIGSGYILGILMASAALHALGTATVLLMIRADQDKGEAASRLVGGLLTLVGVGFLFS
jgi:urease accessory protein